MSGPIVLFDKSAVEMMNVDEAAIFDCLYSSNICPIYYVEVLADLQKAETSGRTHVKVVADMARKTPVMHSYPNMHHSTICLQELLGSPTELRGAPVIGGGRPVRHKGRVGIVYAESPEAQAFSRWQREQFHEVEHRFARAWREQLKAADLSQLASLVKGILAIHKSPKNEKEAFALAKEAVEGAGQRFLTLKLAYSLLGLPSEFWTDVVKRWKASGYPRLTEYAPYTAHCLLVDVFFYVCIEKSLISPERPSNGTDMAYLYYLPFAMIFTSNDKLHRRTVPFFLNEEQMFVPGNELKRDLQALDRFYSELPADTMQVGLYKASKLALAHDEFMVSRIHKHFGRQVGHAPPTQYPSREPLHAEVLRATEGLARAAKAQRTRLPFTQRELRDPDSVMIERKVPLVRGKWRFMPPGIENTKRS